MVFFLKKKSSTSWQLARKKGYKSVAHLLMDKLGIRLSNSNWGILALEALIPIRVAIYQIWKSYLTLLVVNQVSSATVWGYDMLILASFPSKNVYFIISMWFQFLDVINLRLFSFQTSTILVGFVFLVHWEPFFRRRKCFQVCFSIIIIFCFTIPLPQINTCCYDSFKIIKF